jgi:transcriptional regulator with GAF, ATPase, and Fis domain
MQRIAAYGGADLAQLWRADENEDEFAVSVQWVRPEIDSKLLAVEESWPWIKDQMTKGNVVCLASVDDLPPEATTDRDSYLRSGFAGSVSVPVDLGGKVVGTISLASCTPVHWTDSDATRLRLFAEVIGNALQRKKAEEELQAAFTEISGLKEQLEAENILLREEIMSSRLHAGIVGQSDAMRKIMGKAEQVAPTDSTVLIQGETGTGKELLARSVHNLSTRSEKPLVIVNCAAIPSSLVESELFGHEKGAFTGAVARKIGRFEAANEGTLFLDEIGELPLDTQAKLLRALQSGELERLGGTGVLMVDVRVIAATNRDLAREVREGRFREDLFYRLNVFPIDIPPLRDRAEDIPELVWTFIEEFGQRMGKRVESIPKRAMETIQRYRWPGNVRELRNVIERAMIQAQGDTLSVSLPESEIPLPPSGRTLTEIQRQHIAEVLEHTDWRVRGPGGASEILGLKPTTLEAKMRKLNIVRPKMETTSSF